MYWPFICNGGSETVESQGWGRNCKHLSEKLLGQRGACVLALFHSNRRFRGFPMPRIVIEKSSFVERVFPFLPPHPVAYSRTNGVAVARPSTYLR